MLNITQQLRIPAAYISDCKKKAPFRVLFNYLVFFA
jgi:hypothetical protein